MSSGCGDVLSLADLQTAKKHQLFEAEVITGKAGGIASGADIDYATNQVTGQTQKTMPAILRDIGFKPVSWDFSTGGTLGVNDRNKVVYDPVSKTWYSYAGTLPVTVPAGFNPVGNANWVPQTDPNLRTDLAAVGGASLIGAPRGSGTLAQYLDRMFIFIDDLPGVDGTGATDSAAGLNAALTSYSGTGVEFVGKSTSTYLLESTVSFIGLSNITLNFNGGIVKDNVQGFIPDSGNRANHTFVIYNASNIHLQGFRYQQVATRANRVPLSGPNTCMIWVGGQYLGGAMTRDIKVTNIYNLENNACDDGFFLCGMGELDNLLVEDIYLKGGNWNWGVNFEYGLAPEDPAANQTMTNGRHPYNITVRNMRGENLTSCDGFLRVGGAYNIMFEQCTGYNVTNFIHYFSGDRGVTRFGQNVYYKNCKAKHDPSVITVADNMVWIIVTDHDGSTGDPLPTWTNRYHEIIFDNCEFWNSGVLGGSCVRFVSNAGKTTLRNCTLKGGFYGVWAQPGGRATENPRYSLTIQNCVIQNCFQFFRGIDAQGSKVDHCTFIGRQQGATAPTQVPAVVLSGDCSGTVFSDNLFTVPNGISATNWFNNQSAGVTLERNKFEPALTSDYPVITTSPIRGRGNETTSTYLVDPSESSYRMVDEPVISKNLALVSGSVIDFDKGAIWTIGGTKTVNSITGGKPGQQVIINPTAGAANVTFEFGTVTGENRIVPRTVATEVKTGTGWSKTFVKMAGTSGWWEIS